MKIGILTCARLPELLESDQKLISLFTKENISAKAVIWDDESVDWRQFDYLIFRNTWDYYQKENAFNSWLHKIELLGIKTFNPISVIQKNKHKFYLKDLEKEGITILPTIFLGKNSISNLHDLIPKSWDKMVIKPAFSAGSYLTKLIDRTEIESIQNEFKEHFSTKDFLLQEFRPEIKELGETSFIFFDGKFSHAVNKKPVENDFRVQIQYGGKYTLIEPNIELLEQAKLVLSKIPEKLLYARVDGIVIENKLHLMEIELIEPDLYFDLADGARERFVESFLKVLRS
ncbi:RimK family alpha-L-glutamate ligase [Flavobacterium sp.]|jgi:glutathione synthase/RimK-type ligase-like ATP-grasp enzyme|uniref:RimK family alpha-L-glutamate ligase n=1 Tax=Flavobacterium sp. TaxID=239 RepID=UPI0037C0F22B